MTPNDYETTIAEIRAAAASWKSMYDSATANLHDAKCRIADLEAAAKNGPGPLSEEIAVFERDESREENLKLREEVAALAAELDGTRARLTMTTRDLDAAERTVAALKTVAHAIVNAVAKGAL